MKKPFPSRESDPESSIMVGMGLQCPAPDHVFAIRYRDDVIDDLDYRQELRSWGRTSHVAAVHHYFRTPFCYAKEIQHQYGQIIPLNAVEHVYLVNSGDQVYESFYRPWSRKRQFNQRRFVAEEVPLPEWLGHLVRTPRDDEYISPVHSQNADAVELWFLTPKDRKKYEVIKTFLGSSTNLSKSPDSDLWIREAQKYLESVIQRFSKAQEISTEESSDVIQRTLFRFLNQRDEFCNEIIKVKRPQDQIAAFYSRLRTLLGWTVKSQIRRELNNPLAKAIRPSSVLKNTISFDSNLSSNEETFDDFWDSAVSIDVRQGHKVQEELINGKDAIKTLRVAFRKVKDGPLLFKVLELKIFKCKSYREITECTKLTPSKIGTALGKAVKYSRRILVEKGMYVPGEPLRQHLMRFNAAVGLVPVPTRPVKRRRARISQRAAGNIRPKAK